MLASSARRFSSSTTRWPSVRLSALTGASSGYLSSSGCLTGGSPSRTVAPSRWGWAVVWAAAGPGRVRRGCAGRRGCTHAWWPSPQRDLLVAVRDVGQVVAAARGDLRLSVRIGDTFQAAGGGPEPAGLQLRHRRGRYHPAVSHGAHPPPAGRPRERSGI